MSWLWGGLGALVFAGNALIFALWNTGQTQAGRYKATAEFALALVTGSIFAEGLTGTLQKMADQWFKTDAVAVALTIGWASNYLWPIILRRLGKSVNDFTPKGPDA